MSVRSSFCVPRRQADCAEGAVGGDGGGLGGGGLLQHFRLDGHGSRAGPQIRAAWFGSKVQSRSQHRLTYPKIGDYQWVVA